MSRCVICHWYSFLGLTLKDVLALFSFYFHLRESPLLVAAFHLTRRLMHRPISSVLLFIMLIGTNLNFVQKLPMQMFDASSDLYRSLVIVPISFVN